MAAKDVKFFCRWHLFMVWLVEVDLYNVNCSKQDHKSNKIFGNNFYQLKIVELFVTSSNLSHLTKRYFQCEQLCRYNFCWLVIEKVLEV